MVAGYGIGLLAAASLLVWAHDRLGGISRTDLLQKAAEQRLAADPDNAALHLLLANIYFEQHRFEDAEAHYRATLRLEPLHSEALNNLAWLYATAEDERFRDPEEALRLALRAAALDPQPHILDTLAESYFVNGAYDEAIATIKQAIAQKPADAAYYQRQLEKYEEKMRAGPAEEAPREPDDERVAL